MIILLLSICLVLLLISLGLGFLLVKAIKRIQAYEDFFEETIKDIDDILVFLKQIFDTRQLLYEDPDVQKIYKATGMIYVILTNYVNSGRKETNKTQKKEGDWPS